MVDKIDRYDYSCNGWVDGWGGDWVDGGWAGAWMGARHGVDAFRRLLTTKNYKLECNVHTPTTICIAPLLASHF